MDLTTLIQSVQTSLGGHLPALLGAVAIGLLGWLAASLFRAIARRSLTAIDLDRRLNTASGTQLPISSFIAQGLYALVLVLTALAVLNALNLGTTSGPIANMANEVLAFLPNLLAGLVLGIVAWACAIAVRTIVARVSASRLIDARISTAIGTKTTMPLSNQLAQAGFWLTLLFFLPAVLGALQLNGLLSPVQSMMSSVLGAMPNILAALAIGVVGYLVAKLLRSIVANVLDAAGANRAAGKLGLDGSFRLSALAGTIVYVMVLLPTMIAALDALKIEAVSKPASVMLVRVFEAVPNIVAATVILGLTFFVARIVAGLAREFLAGVGADTLPEKLGLSQNNGRFRVSVTAGKAMMFFAMMFAAVEATNRLGFTSVGELVNSFIRFSADLLLGGVILIAGFWLANLAHDAIQRGSRVGNTPLARIARFAILGLVLAMGLRAMGIAPDIVNIAFGLTLGAVAVAGALSFGLGGREAAGRQMEHWLSGWRNAGPVAPQLGVSLSDGKPEHAGMFPPPRGDVGSLESKVAK